MAQSSSNPNPINQTPIGNIVWDIVLNAVFPVILYKLSKRYYSPSEFTALVVAALFPIGKSRFELIYHRQVDPISILVLLGIGVDSVALLFWRQSATVAGAGIPDRGRVRARVLFHRFSGQKILSCWEAVARMHGSRRVIEHIVNCVPKMLGSLRPPLKPIEPV
jgi:hypothetical protein